VAAGFRAASPRAEVILVHDAARAFVTRGVIERTVAAAARHGAAVAAVAARDTVKQARGGPEGPVITVTLPRDEIFLAQTPQGFRREVLEAAVALGDAGVDATDEARLAELAGFSVTLVQGDPRNLKVTTEEDLHLALARSSLEGTPAGHEAAALVGPESPGPFASGAASRGEPMHGTEAGFRVGHGYDSHRLVDGRPLILGGVRIPFEKGLAGHSDADAVAHAVTDAVLGAAALGDIGQLFPDSDARWKDADSLVLLAQAVDHVRARGFGVWNVDVTIVAERPRVGPYREAMRAKLARALGTQVAAVSVKGKTNEGLDAVGRGEGIVVHAVALLARSGVRDVEP
jgi:2-C-methyl-D-erythritol 4-phosphate cytidylyltransferase/2-C-methyl-D-erythritol 2,4-cyclodiphosphate synthase